MFDSCIPKQRSSDNGNESYKDEGMYDDISLLRSGEGGDFLDESGCENDKRLTEVEELVKTALLKDMNGYELENIGISDECIEPNGKVETQNMQVVTHIFNDSKSTKEFY